MTYREFFSHTVDVVEAVGATILIVGGLGAFARYAREIVTPRGQDAFGDLRKNLGRYVFVSPDGTPLERSNFRCRVWIPATRHVGLDGLRFHDLRHAAGTLAAQTGATTKEIMYRLGHASPRAAMMYQHATEDRDRLIADRLADMAAQAGLAAVVPLQPESATASHA